MNGETEKSVIAINGTSVNGHDGLVIPSEESAAGRHGCKLTPRYKNVCISILLMVFGAICWSVVTLAAQSALSLTTFKSPFFLVYFASAWKLLVFPAFLFLHIIKTREKFSLRLTIRSGN